MSEPWRDKRVIGDATLYLGDCRDVLPYIGKVDAVVTDPPYGVDLGIKKDMRRNGHGLGKTGYADQCDTLEAFQSVVVPRVESALYAAKRGAVFCTYNLHDLPKPDAIGGVYIPAASGRHCWGFNSLSLVGLYGTAPSLNLGARSTVFQSNEASEEVGHPCPKPLGWMDWLVGLASREGEIVCDPFMGSGTTGVACARLGRYFIGIEIESRYFEIACRRIDDAQRQGRLLFDAPKPKATQLELHELAEVQ